MTPIKVNIKTLEAVREPLPRPLRGLKPKALQNLQAELDPVPADFQDVEFWPAEQLTVDYDPLTHKLDGEVLEPDPEVKCVRVTPTTVPLSTEEAEAAAAQEKEKQNLEANRANLDNDTLLAVLKSNTMTEIEAYIDGQFSGLAGMTGGEIDKHVDSEMADLPESARAAFKILAKDMARAMSMLKITTKLAVYLFKN